MKGQKSRAGNRPAPVVRELLKRYPKLKGYRRVRRQRKPPMVSLAIIERKFALNEVVSPTTLVEKGLVRQQKSSDPKIKIVGSRKLKNALTVQRCILSVGAKKSIEASGGKIT